MNLRGSWRNITEPLGRMPENGANATVFMIAATTRMWLVLLDELLAIVCEFFVLDCVSLGFVTLHSGTWSGQIFVTSKPRMAKPKHIGSKAYKLG